MLIPAQRDRVIDPDRGTGRTTRAITEMIARAMQKDGLHYYICADDGAARGCFEHTLSIMDKTGKLPDRAVSARRIIYLRPNTELRFVALRDVDEFDRVRGFKISSFDFDHFQHRDVSRAAIILTSQVR